MKAYDCIIAKQTQWALNRGIQLAGSKGSRGRPAYTPTLDDNLFQPLSDFVRKSFENGDGDEINGSPNSPAKMQAVHSSSALGVNVFQYWQSICRESDIAEACGFCKKGSSSSLQMIFEDKYAIDTRFNRAPNIDVVFHSLDMTPIKRFAVECKFSEAYSSQRHSGLKPAYLDLSSAWSMLQICMSWQNRSVLMTIVLNISIPHS